MSIKCQKIRLFLSLFEYQTCIPPYSWHIKLRHGSILSRECVLRCLVLWLQKNDEHTLLLACPRSSYFTSRSVRENNTWMNLCVLRSCQATLLAEPGASPCAVAQMASPTPAEKHYSSALASRHLPAQVR